MPINDEYTLQAVGYLNSIYTFSVFIISCFSFAFMLFVYLIVRFFRDLWLSYLEKKFPSLEFIKESTLRSVVDTQRNMGIITILVTVRGNCDPAMIKTRLIKDILDKKQSDGEYVHRHLKMSLTRNWGWYAWQKQVPFNIDQHLIFASSHYRGRPISDANIQECVSETVSKYLVPELPPWQITVYQLATSDKYYLLIRFHHMLLSREGIDLGSLLTINENGASTSQAEMEENSDSLFGLFSPNTRPHPFQELYKTPKALPELYKQLYTTINSIWKDFLSLYDPTENPSILKKPGLKATVAVFIIVIVAVIKQLFLLRTKLSYQLIANEFFQRGLTISYVLRSLWNTFNPFSFTKIFIKNFFKLITLPGKLFWRVGLELHSYFLKSEEDFYRESYVRVFISIWNILKFSVKEVTYYFKMFYTGPRTIMEEFFLANKYSKHHLQFVSLCGRKVVSWSNSVPLKLIHEIQDVTGATPSEIFITAASASLRDFLVQYSADIPDSVPVTARYFPQEQLIESRKENWKSCGSGILCLPLPIRNPFGLEYDPVTELRAVQQIILRARLRQPALYLASLSQLEYGILTQVLPSPILRLILNFLSRRFPVILSEVAPSGTGGAQKRSFFGQEVEDLMYWKPPQANICMSLTLMTFGNKIKLGIVADALLSPHHAVITSTFAQHIWELARAAGVTTNLENYSFISDDSDSTEAGRSSRNLTLSSSSLDLDVDIKNFSDDENNLNQDNSLLKYPLKKNLQLNIPC